MNAPGNAIEVENLSKFYTLLYLGRDRRGLRHVINDAITAPFRIGRAAKSPAKEQFWALRDVSFSVKQGDTIGVIGRNGAGKSTLLKVLSRITEPTSGRIRVRGRIGSLLEVGTGFHPELTGRENVFLNGAILGMTRAEIKAKFDEIVAFAEVEKFLEMPVKRYSSGMYVRLAFAVAAHLEPEILVIDEVLAVGDAQFQKKCLGKMQEVSRSHGRTIFFVSHNMGAVSQLCQRGLLLEAGRVALDGDAESVVARYLSGTSASGVKLLVEDVAERRRHRKVFFHNIALLNHL
ncbi:MAG TPA: ABC transporter ATP-binding protein, partial [Verrucomicrobiae bacterium]